MNQKRISYSDRAVTTYPTTHITINKSRIKTYPYNQIFMADGSEFQIELDNCTNFVWLAVISVNGEKISDSGLVLKPGEHVFLDTPNISSSGKKSKFKFETYEIEQGRSHLVANNGKVKIEFYREQSLPHWIIDYTTYPPYPYRRDWYTDPQFPGQFYYSSSGQSANISGDPMTYSNVCSSDAPLKVSEKNPCKEVPLGEPAEHIMPMEETGRIEKGSKSKQKFHKTNYDFESFASHVDEFQIFPLSKRVVTIQEATREYCTECGKRRKKNFRFCPKCGTKF